LPFAVGLVPLFLQNGLWVNDAFVGGAVTAQAKNSPKFDITNFDTTFFVGTNKVTTPVFITDGVIDDNAGKFYALTTFVDVAEGYLEAGYARVTDDRDDFKWTITTSCSPGLNVTAERYPTVFVCSLTLGKILFLD
jgi:hypothetical protein